MSHGLNAGSLSPRRIQWSILEEHLDEAAYLWSQRERMLLSSKAVLAEVAEGVEGRLLAHLTGLQLGGTPVIERLLRPCFVDDDWCRVAVASHVLLTLPGVDGVSPVLAALTDSEPETRRGLLRALELSVREDLNGSVSRLSRAAEPVLGCSLLGCLALRQAPTDELLQQRPMDDTPEGLMAVLHAARFASRDVAARRVARGLVSLHPGVRDAAIATGLILHERASWIRCRGLVEKDGASSGIALLALSMGGGPREVELLLRVLEAPASRAWAAWALGFSGRKMAAEALLKLLRGGEGGWLECRSFAAITGMPLEGVLAAPPGDESEEEHPAQEAMVEEAQGTLPGPASEPGAVRVDVVDAWWRREGARFQQDGRYLFGKPWSTEALIRALETAPMRQRPILAWELSVRGQGACQLKTRAWSKEQCRQLKAARALRAAPETGSFSGFLRS